MSTLSKLRTRNLLEAESFSSIGLPYLNVRDYGAKGDGVTNDRAAIQAAINAAAATHGTVFFPWGTYAIFSALTVPSFVHLVGASMQNSIIWNKGAGHAIHMVDLVTFGDKVVKNSSIANLSVLGPTYAYGVLATVGSSLDGIYIENPFMVVLDMVRVEGHGRVGVALNSGAYAGNWGQNFKISNSWVSLNGVGGIKVYGAYRNTIADISGNNSIMANRKYNIYIEQGWVINIEGNEIASQGWDAITGTQGHGIVINEAQTVRIAANSLEAMSGGMPGSAVPCNFIRTGFNGDTQVNTTGGVWGFYLNENVFNPGAPNVDLIRLRGVFGGDVSNNWFWRTTAGGTSNIFVIDSNSVYPLTGMLDQVIYATSDWNNVVSILGGGAYVAKKVHEPTFGANITISAAEMTDHFRIINNSAAAFTINNPVGFGHGHIITISIVHVSFWGLGAVTWGAAYKKAAWAAPVAGAMSSITFRLHTDGVWHEISRSADVPIGA